MDIDVESQASQQEGTTADEEKPFRLTKPEGIVSKLYSYQLESLTWMTVQFLPLCLHCTTKQTMSSVQEIEDRVSRGMYWESISFVNFPNNVKTHVRVFIQPWPGHSLW